MFIRVCVGSHGCCRGHSGSPVFTAAHLDVGVFILVLVRSLHRVHSGSRGFTGAGLGVIVSFAWVPSGAPRGRRVHSGSRVFIRARLSVVGLIQVRLGALFRH